MFLMRRLNYLLHAWLGLGLAFFILTAALTGAVLVIAEEIDAWLVHPEWHEVQAGSDGRAEALPLDRIYQRLQERFPEHAVSGMTLAQKAGGTHQVWLVREGSYEQVFVHPGTAEVLGVRNTPWMTIVVRLHYSLLLGDWGGALMFGPALGMVILGTTGLWIHRAAWRAMLRWPRFRSGAGLRLGFSDLHKALGVPLYVFLLVLGLTATYLNAGFVITVVTGQARPPWDVRVTRVFQRAEVSLDAAVKVTQQRLEGLRPYYIGFPRDDHGILNVFGPVPGHELYGPYGGRVGVDARTGEIRQVEDCRELSWSGKAMALVTPLHFGNFGGGWVKALYVVCSLGLVGVTLTGVGVWWSRRRKRVRSVG